MTNFFLRPCIEDSALLLDGVGSKEAVVRGEIKVKVQKMFSCFPLTLNLKDMILVPTFGTYLLSFCPFPSGLSPLKTQDPELGIGELWQFMVHLHLT